MQKLLTLMAVSLFSIVPLTAYAGSNTGLVTSIYSNINGLASITMTGNYNTYPPPACAATSTTTTTFIIDATTTVGQMWVRSLYASKLAGQPVTIDGQRQCNGSQELAAVVIF